MIPIFGTSAVLVAPPAPLLSSGYVAGNTLVAQHFNYQLNHLTKELNNVLSMAGVTQNASVDTQLTTAIQILITAGLAITGTAATLASNNPIPAAAQIAYETDTKFFKIGDGSTAYNSLMYQPQKTLETAYTPNFTGFGTVSNVNFTWARVGNRCKVMGRFKTGTCTAIEGRISLPGSLVSDSALIATLQICGIWVINYAGAVSMYCLIEPSNGYIVFGYQNATNAAFGKANGNAINSNTDYTVQFEVPIANWNV